MTDAPGSQRSCRAPAPLESAQRLRVAFRHGAYFLRRADTRGELTSQQISLMTMLTEGGQRMTSIAANLGVRTPTATQSVDRLVRAGLVQRRPDPDDARAVLVCLTQRGTQVIAAEDRHRSEVVAEMLAQLTAQEVATLDAALPIIEKLASPRSGMTGEGQARPLPRGD